jgi:hypothetical protein
MQYGSRSTFFMSESSKSNMVIKKADSLKAKVTWWFMLMLSRIKGYNLSNALISFYCPSYSLLLPICIYSCYR